MQVAIDYINLLAMNIMDVKLKHFISTCSTWAVPQSKIQWPDFRTRVTSDYLGHAVTIDIHNHALTGSVAPEDALHIYKILPSMATYFLMPITLTAI